MANEQKYLVYVHINKINGKKYVGITKEKPERRWGKNGCRYRTGVFAKAIAKYGWDNFEHKILFENLSQIEAQQREIDLIKEFRSFANEYGYNSTKGGERYFGFVFSDQTNVQMETELVVKLVVKLDFQWLLVSVVCIVENRTSPCPLLL